MKGYFIIGFIFASLHGINAQDEGCKALKGECKLAYSQCCDGEIVYDDTLCPSSTTGQACCLPEAKCEEDLGHYCIPMRHHNCPSNRVAAGFCSGNRICCKDDLRKMRTGRGGGAPPLVCSAEGQKDACNVMADPQISIPTGQHLVDEGFTTVIDGSAPWDNIWDTCQGFEIQTTTNEHFCNGTRLCLYEMVPRFLRCYRRLCGPFDVLNIASDSAGEFWEWHCLGHAVDVISPSVCDEYWVAQRMLCQSLGGSGKYYDSTTNGQPKSNNVFNCRWAPS